MRKIIGKIAEGYSGTSQKFVEGKIYHNYSNGIDILTKDGLVFVENGKYKIIGDKMMNENKIKTMLNVEILNRMSDGSASAVLKNILFSGKNSIDWDEVYGLMIDFMPELKTVEGYKVENMQ